MNMVALDLSPRSVKELKYTIHDSYILVVALDQVGAPFFYESMHMDVVEGRSLSLKAKMVFEYHTGRKVSSKTKAISVRPNEFLQEYGHGFGDKRS